MSTLYLDRRDLSLKLSGPSLAIYADGQCQRTFPVHLLERIVLRSNVHIDSSAMARLVDSGISIVAFGGRLGDKLMMSQGITHGDGARRIGQYRRYDDQPWQQRWARVLVRCKLRRQRQLLREALTDRPDQRLPLQTAIDALGVASRRLQDETDLGLEPLRGIEGAAAAAYFRGYTALFPSTLDFTGRNRRPPRDPVNAVLSLGYTLLHAEAVRACHGSGLDPIIGYYHRLHFGRPSMASDLIEPVRPRIDRLVWDLFRERALRAEDFQTNADGCLLDKAGRARFYPAYEKAMADTRRLLRRAVQRLARDFARVGEEATPL